MEYIHLNEAPAVPELVRVFADDDNLISSNMTIERFLMSTVKEDMVCAWRPPERDGSQHKMVPTPFLSRVQFASGRTMFIARNPAFQVVRSFYELVAELPAKRRCGLFVPPLRCDLVYHDVSIGALSGAGPKTLGRIYKLHLDAGPFIAQFDKMVREHDKLDIHTHALSGASTPTSISEEGPA